MQTYFYDLVNWLYKCTVVTISLFFLSEQQVKELQAQLIMERHNLEDKDHNNKQLMHEVDALRSKHLLLNDEDNALKLKVL